MSSGGRTPRTEVISLPAPVARHLLGGSQKGLGVPPHVGSTEEFLAMPLPGQEQEMGFFEERA